MSAEFLDGLVRYDTDYRTTNVDVTTSSLEKLQRADAAATSGAGTSMRHSNGIAPDTGSNGTGAETGRGAPLSDEIAMHDERSAPVSWLGCSVAKLFEICVASSIHTVVWVVLLLWIDLLYASHIFSGQSIVDTAFACLFIWISTFMCFYALVEDDN